MTTSPLKILLVDDMDIIMDIIITYLETMEEEYIYFKAQNGRIACKLAKQQRPDLIIMDWEMPQMNGIEALQILKKNDSTKDIPVIISSGFSEDESIRKAIEAGAIGYVQKPIDSKALITRIKSVLALDSSKKSITQKQQTH